MKKLRATLSGNNKHKMLLKHLVIFIPIFVIILFQSSFLSNAIEYDGVGIKVGNVWYFCRYKHDYLLDYYRNIGESFEYSFTEDDIEIIRMDNHQPVSPAEKQSVIDACEFEWHYENNDEPLVKGTSIKVTINSEEDFGNYTCVLTAGENGLDTVLSIYVEEADTYYVEESEGSSRQYPKVGDYFNGKWEDDDEIERINIAAGTSLDIDGLKDVRWSIYRISEVEVNDDKDDPWTTQDKVEDKDSLDLKYEWYKNDSFIQEGRILHYGVVSSNTNENIVLRLYIKSYSGEYKIIRNVGLELISIDPYVNLPANSKLPLQKGQKFKLKAEIAPRDAILEWKSSNPKVVSVDAKGNIEGKKIGTAKISVRTVLGAKATLKVKVQKGSVKTTKIKVLNKYLYGEEGNNSEKLVIQRYPVTSKQKVTFSSSNKKIATIDKSGTMKLKKVGTVVITIKSGNVTKKIKYKVTESGDRE